MTGRPRRIANRTTDRQNSASLRQQRSDLISCRHDGAAALARRSPWQHQAIIEREGRGEPPSPRGAGRKEPFHDPDRPPVARCHLDQPGGVGQHQRRYVGRLRARVMDRGAAADRIADQHDFFELLLLDEGGQQFAVAHHAWRLAVVIRPAVAGPIQHGHAITRRQGLDHPIEIATAVTDGVQAHDVAALTGLAERERRATDFAPLPRRRHTEPLARRSGHDPPPVSATKAAISSASLSGWSSAVKL